MQTATTPQKITQRFYLWLFIVLVIGGTLIQTIKLQTLSFHSRDFTFYAEFSQKVLSLSLPRVYSINPGGQNLFGNTGIEGSQGFHFTIHMEPIKYIIAAVATVSPYTLPAVFFCFSLLFFCPILYSWYLLRRDENNAPTALLGTLLFMYPALFWNVGFDLRPYALLGPAFILAVMSQVAKRPLAERILTLMFLLLVREEALVFAGAICLMLVTRLSVRSERLAFMACSSLTGIYAISLFTYFHFAGFAKAEARAINIFSDYRYSILVYLFYAWIILGITLLIYRYIKRTTLSQNLLEAALLSAPLIPMGWQFVNMNYPDFISLNRVVFLKSLLHTVAFNPRYGLYIVVVVAVIIAIVGNSKNKLIVHTKGFMITMFALSAPLLLSILNFLYSSVPAISNNQNLWKQIHGIETQNTLVVCDYRTHQALTGIAHLYNFQRLPLYLDNEQNRNYPDNRPLLDSILTKPGVLLVISKKSAKELLPILTTLRIKCMTVFEDQDYFIGSLSGRPNQPVSSQNAPDDLH